MNTSRWQDFLNNRSRMWKYWRCREKCCKCHCVDSIYEEEKWIGTDKIRQKCSFRHIKNSITSIQILNLLITVILTKWQRNQRFWKELWYVVSLKTNDALKPRMWWSVRTDYVMSPPPLPALNPPSSIMITIEMDSLLFLSWFFRNERTHTFLSLLQVPFLWRCIQEDIRNDISYLCHSHFLCSKRCSSVSLTLRLIWSVSLHLR